MTRCMKLSYPTKAAALSAALGVLRKGDMRYMRPYYCEDCKAYHVTKMKREWLK